MSPDGHAERGTDLVSRFSRESYPCGVGREVLKGNPREPGPALVVEPVHGRPCALVQQVLADGASVGAGVDARLQDLTGEPAGRGEGQGQFRERAVDVEVALAQVALGVHDVSPAGLEEVSRREQGALVPVPRSLVVLVL